MKESDIQIALAKHFDWFRNYMLPNYGRGIIRGFEDDLVMIRPSRLCEIFEIKLSWSDYRADFKKSAYHSSKHDIIEKGIPKVIYKSQVTKNWDKRIASSSTELKYNNDNEPYVAILWDDVKPHFAAKFWFACPSDLACKIQPQLPTYSGLIAVNDHGKVTIVKKAPKLNNSIKIPDQELIRILRSGYCRWWSEKMKNHNQHVQN